jgi:hypothetical protein
MTLTRLVYWFSPTLCFLLFVGLEALVIYHIFKLAGAL